MCVCWGGGIGGAVLSDSRAHPLVLPSPHSLSGPTSGLRLSKTDRIRDTVIAASTEYLSQLGSKCAFTSFILHSSPARVLGSDPTFLVPSFPKDIKGAKHKCPAY